MWMLFNRCILKIVAAVSLDVIEEHTMMTTIPTSHILKINPWQGIKIF